MYCNYPIMPSNTCSDASNTRFSTDFRGFHTLFQTVVSLLVIFGVLRALDQPHLGQSDGCSRG